MKDTAELQKLYLADCAKGSGLGYGTHFNRRVPAAFISDIRCPQEMGKKTEEKEG
jgi:hypothetical protein